MTTRETASWVLNFVDDNLSLMGNSGLAISPTMSLGKDRASAIQLSGVGLIVLMTLFVRARFATSLDVLAWTVICAAYLSVVSFLVHKIMQGFDPPILDSDTRDIRLDGNVYVLFFNVIAVFMFAIVEEFLLDTIYYGAGGTAKKSHFTHDNIRDSWRGCGM